MRSLCLLLVALSAYSTSLFGQASLTPGDRVRLQADSVSGRFQVIEVTADTLVLEAVTTRALVRVPTASITQLSKAQMRTGWQGALRGAGLGLLVGAGTGLVIGFASGDDDPVETFFAFTAEEKALALGIVLGGASSVLGGVIGAISPGERWAPIIAPTTEWGRGQASSLVIGYAVKF